MGVGGIAARGLAVTGAPAIFSVVSEYDNGMIKDALDKGYSTAEQFGYADYIKKAGSIIGSGLKTSPEDQLQSFKCAPVTLQPTEGHSDGCLNSLGLVDDSLADHSSSGLMAGGSTWSTERAHLLHYQPPEDLAGSEAILHARCSHNPRRKSGRDFFRCLLDAVVET